MATGEPELIGPLAERRTSRLPESPAASDPDDATRRERVAAFEALFRRIGRRYRDCRVDSFARYGTREERETQERAVRRCCWYGETMPERVAKGEGIVFLGPVGTGKDHLASALAKLAVLRRGLTVEWVDGTRLYGMLRDGMDLNTPEGNVLAPFERADVFYISDPVPPESDLSKFERSVLWRLIDGRYRDLKPTWVTCNWEDGSEAERATAKAIVDRLRDRSLMVDCSWETYREPIGPPGDD